MDFPSLSRDTEVLCHLDDDGGIWVTLPHSDKTFEDIKKEDYFLDKETTLVKLQDLPPMSLMGGWIWNGQNQPITLDLEKGKKQCCEYLAFRTEEQAQDKSTFASDIAQGQNGTIVPMFEETIDAILAAQTAEAADQAAVKYKEFLFKQQPQAVSQITELTQSKLSAFAATAGAEASTMSAPEKKRTRKKAQ